MQKPNFILKSRFPFFCQRGRFIQSLPFTIWKTKPFVSESWLKEDYTMLKYLIVCCIIEHINTYRRLMNEIDANTGLILVYFVFRDFNWMIKGQRFLSAKIWEYCKFYFGDTNLFFKIISMHSFLSWFQLTKFSHTQIWIEDWISQKREEIMMTYFIPSRWYILTFVIIEIIKQCIR